MPLIDILMPVRNASPFLEGAVLSLLAQTFHDWRLVVVDDRSSDDTWKMLCAFGKADERILALKNEGSGLVNALNTALAHSRAPYLARMDGDDLSEPSRLEKMLKLMQSRYDVSVAGSRVRLFPADAVTPNMKRYIKWQNSLLTPEEIRRERYVESTLTHGSAMFRREDLAEAGGWRKGPFPEDLDLWLRLHREGVKFAKHPEVLYLWREHGGRTTRDSERCTPEAFHRCKVMHLAGELSERQLVSLAVLGPARTRKRWAHSLKENGFNVISHGWKPGESMPRHIEEADFILAAFGVPAVRTKAREELKDLGEEDQRWLFVG